MLELYNIPNNTDASFENIPGEQIVNPGTVCAGKMYLT